MEVSNRECARCGLWLSGWDWRTVRQGKIETKRGYLNIIFRESDTLISVDVVNNSIDILSLKLDGVGPVDNRPSTD